MLSSPGVEPPSDPAIAAYWHGFWIAAVVIVAVVALVVTIITKVNRIEKQAAMTVVHLSAGKEASSPFEDLVEANVHLRALLVPRPSTATQAGGVS